MGWESITSLAGPTAGIFDLPSLNLGPYKAVQLMLSGVTVTTDGTDLRLTMYVGTEVVGNYHWAVLPNSTGGTANSDSSTSSVAVFLNSITAAWDTGNAAQEAFGATITVDAPTSALQKKVSYEAYHVGPTGNAINGKGVGLMENTGAITGFKVAGSSSLLTGRLDLLGLE